VAVPLGSVIVWRFLRSRDQDRSVPEVPRGGVSSFHLWWGGWSGAIPIVEVAATLTVTRAPAVARLYFWALQVGFSDGRRSYGAAHTGLQWNPNHPRSRAVNWGGYAEPPVGGVLDGSVPALAGSPDDPNTRAYAWEPGTPYRFRVHRSSQGWRSEVTDLATGEVTVIRDLYAGGDRLTGPVVWSEVFARCVDPPVEVRWTDLVVVLADGSIARPGFVTATFPSAGDCPNTDSRVEGDTLVQATNTPRTSRDGQRMAVPAAEAGG